MKQIFIVCCAIFVAFTGQAQSLSWTDPITHVEFFFKIIDPINKYVRIGGNDVNNGSGGTKQVAPNTTSVITIPGTIPYNGDTYKVTEVGTHTIDITLSTAQRKVVISENIRVLHQEAISNDVMTLEEIVFPSSLEVIENSACNNLQSLKYIDLSNTHVRYIGKYAFWMCGYTSGSISYIRFPKTLQRIERDIVGLGETSNVKSLVLPEKLDTIDVNAFTYMSLDEITFQNPRPALIYQGNAPSTSNEGPLDPNVGFRRRGVNTVYVPIDATKAYQTTPIWSNQSAKYREKVNIGATGYTSYYLENENFLIPAGCTAYIITGITPSGSKSIPDQANVTAFTAGKIIPKQTGFILKGTPNSTVVYQANVTGTEESVAGNWLVGTAIEQEFSSAGHKYYMLANGDEGIGFYKQGTRKGASIKLQPHRAGLRLADAVAPAKGLIIDFDAAREEAETTGIRDVRPSVQPREDIIYDLQGRRVKNPGQGIYIVNGKKVVRE